MDPRAWARITFAVTSLTTAMNSTPLKTSSTPSLASIPTIPGTTATVQEILQPMELQFGGESDNLPQLTLSRVQLSTASLLLPALHQSSLVPVDHYAPTVPSLVPHYVMLLFFLYCPAL